MISHFRFDPFITHYCQEEGMSDDGIRRGGKHPNHVEPQVHLQDFELAKAIRGEMAGYIVKAAVISATAVLGTLGAALWTYFEWRLPQIAGGVPKGAVLAFADERCPEGWENFERGKMRAIIGAVPNAQNIDNAHPRPLHFGEQRGEHAEYLLTKAPPREGRQSSENERLVVVPGFLALTYCEKIHER
jgi:hypothetical protein